MALKLHLTLLVVLPLLLASVHAADERDRARNRPNDRGYDDMMDPSKVGKEFRSKQVIQLWQKAYRMKLPKDRMTELHRELARIDSMYHKAKKEVPRKEGSENDILRQDNAEMAVDRQLREAMKKFGLDGGGKGGRENMKVPTSDDQPFSDRKIAHLWMKAQKSKLFSDQELTELKEELTDHHGQLDEFNSLMEEIHGADGGKANNAKRFDNMHPDEVRDIRTKEMDLKLKHRDLQKEFQRINAKTIPEEERGPFVEHRVITLWQEAKKQDFSDEDLQAIKEELVEFEAKILEHETAHRESLEADLTYRVQNPTDKTRGLKDRTLYEKAKELGSSVHEKMRTLRHKISQGGKWNEEL